MALQNQNATLHPAVQTVVAQILHHHCVNDRLSGPRRPDSHGDDLPDDHDQANHAGARQTSGYEDVKNGRPVNAHRLPSANEANIAPEPTEELVEVKLKFALTEKPSV